MADEKSCGTIQAVGSDLLRASAVRIREEKNAFDESVTAEYKANRAAGMNETDALATKDLP